VELKYTLPADEDLLYVKAYYELKDGPGQMSSSVYSNGMTIQGFGDKSTRTIRLVTVDRSRNESQPVSIEVTPKEAPVNVARQSLAMEESWGGVKLTWSNPDRADLSVHVLIPDEVGEFVEIDAFYSANPEEARGVYGLECEPTEFKVFTKDIYGNVSDTLTATMTPWYEAKYDRTLFKNVSNLPPSPYGDNGPAWRSNPAKDVPHDADWVLERAWDGVSGQTNVGKDAENAGFSSMWGPCGSVTIDLGVVGSISRVIYWPQLWGGAPYNDGHLKEWKIYYFDPSQTFDKDDPATIAWNVRSESTYNPSGSTGKWIELCHNISVRPSGQTEPGGSYPAEDLEARDGKGEEFMMPMPEGGATQMPRARYIRILQIRSWVKDNFSIGELEVYGDFRQK